MALRQAVCIGIGQAPTYYIAADKLCTYVYTRPYLIVPISVMTGRRACQSNWTLYCTASIMLVKLSICVLEDGQNLSVMSFYMLCTLTPTYASVMAAHCIRFVICSAIAWHTAAKRSLPFVSRLHCFRWSLHSWCSSRHRSAGGSCQAQLCTGMHCN